jgi:hypothetical protein
VIKTQFINLATAYAFTKRYRRGRWVLFQALKVVAAPDIYFELGNSWYFREDKERHELRCYRAAVRAYRAALEHEAQTRYWGYLAAAATRCFANEKALSSKALLSWDTGSMPIGSS